MLIEKNPINFIVFMNTVVTLRKMIRVIFHKKDLFCSVVLKPFPLRSNLMFHVSFKAYKNLIKILCTLL